MNRKTKIILSSIGGVVVLGGMAFSITLNIRNLNTIKKYSKKVDSMEASINGYDEFINGNDDSEAYIEKENDVPIGGTYTIKDTSAISDAYISGDDSDLDDEEKSTLKLASDVIDKITKKDMTDYEKEMAVYTWITTNISTDDGGSKAIPTGADAVDTPYGVLTNDSAVCVGYATTFRLLMNMLGIDCMVVHDDGLSHSWDYVNIESGWYHVDCYMDSTDNKEPSFINFNLTDSMAMESHSWNMTILPESDTDEYSYAVKNAKKIDDINTITSAVADCFDKKSNKTFYYSIDGDFSIEDYATVKCSIDSMVNYLSEQGDLDEYFVYTYATYNEDGDKVKVITVSVEYYGDESYDEETDDPDNETIVIDREKAKKLAADALGIDENEIDIYVEEYEYYDQREEGDEKTNEK